MNVAVFFGGKTCEHNISVITAVQAIKAIDRVHFIIPVYIDEDGEFWTGGDLDGKIGSFMNVDKNKRGRKKIHFCPSSNYLYSKRGRKLFRVDVALLCNHGLNGEDGTLQGLLELCGIPYSGSSVLASAVGMDKVAMKQCFLTAQLPIVPYLNFFYDEYKGNLFNVAEKIKKSLTFPLIVKPSSLGSSIGIGIARDFNELYQCLDSAFEWDNSVVVENALEDFKELNCAVLGVFDGSKTVSEVESPVGWKSFLTFEDKYINKQKGGGREFPAKIDNELKEKIQDLAKKAFEAVRCSGVARIDFLLKDDELFVNEINTIPGALSNYLFSACETKLSFTSLLERLFEIALQNKSCKDRLKYRFKPSFELKDGMKISK